MKKMLLAAGLTVVSVAAFAYNKHPTWNDAYKTQVGKTCFVSDKNVKMRQGLYDQCPASSPRDVAGCRNNQTLKVAEAVCDCAANTYKLSAPGGVVNKATLAECGPSPFK